MYACSSGSHGMKILAIDDDRTMRRGLFRLFRGMVATAADIGEAMTHIAIEQPMVIILDAWLFKASGIDAIPALREAAPEAQIIVFTAGVNEFESRRARQLGASAYLSKMSIGNLQQIVSGVLSDAAEPALTGA